MANATTADARAGWELYRASGFALSLDDLNAALLNGGHNPIKSRTYRHYQALAARGATRYVSINKFDVASATDPFSGAAFRSRYSPLPDARIPADVAIDLDGSVASVRVLLTEVSESLSLV